MRCKKCNNKIWEIGMDMCIESLCGCPITGGDNDPWDNLKVGQVIETNLVASRFCIVMDTTENSMAFNLSPLTHLTWYSKQIAKESGWTIKDSTPMTPGEAELASLMDKHFEDSTPKEEQKCDHTSIVTCANCSGDYKFEPIKSELTAEEKLEQIKRIL